MSFDRYRAQLLCEGFLGCTTFDDFYLADFGSFTLDRTNAYAFRNSLREDARDLFFKGHLSLLEALEGYKNRNYSWAVIKSYYSVFYMIKADLALRDFGLIRHKTIYYLEAKDGAKPMTKGRNGANRSNYSGDHKSALNYYKDFFSGSDILLSQNINGLSVYEWLMKKREQVNYQERNFNEPNCSIFLDYIDTEINKGNFEGLLKEILEDNPLIKTFQEEYAPLAIPIKRTLLTKKNFLDNAIKINYSTEQKAYLKSFVSYELIEGV